MSDVNGSVRCQTEVEELTLSSTSVFPIPRRFSIKAVTFDGRPKRTRTWSMRCAARSYVNPFAGKGRSFQVPLRVERYRSKLQTRLKKAVNGY